MGFFFRLACLVFAVSSSLVLAGEKYVFVNGEACGRLEHLTITLSDVVVTTEFDCGTQEPAPIIPEPPESNEVDPDCIDDPSICEYFDLPDVNATYDKRIGPGQRHVYQYKTPILDPNAEKKNYWVMFQVIDHGASAFLKLGLSKVKGKTDPEGEVVDCFKGPRIQLSLAAGTDNTYTNCVIDDGTDYYFTIESMETENPGDYRFQFSQSLAY